MSILIASSPEAQGDLATALLWLWRTRALHAALLASLGACDDLAGLDPDREPGACEESSFRLADDLRAQGFDYVELRSDSGFSGQVEDQSGTACATATDVKACQAELFSPGDSPCEQVLGCNAILATRADEVVRVTTGEQFVEKFGQIDSIEAAQAVVWLEASANVCDPAGFGALAKGDEFWVYASNEACVSEDFTERFTISAEGKVTSETVVRGERIEGCQVGRVPAGLCEELRGRGHHPAGRLFSQMANMEAVSIDAFFELATALRAHGAPNGWVKAAERFAGDELRHTAKMEGLARRFGGWLSAPKVAPVATPGLLAFAINNAVEGCVRETYGAMVAALQAEQARDPEVREVMGELAADELEHAALSQRIATWARDRLSAQERAQLAQAVREAIATLRQEAQQAVTPLLHQVAGWPSAAQAVAILDSLEANAWQEMV